MHSIKNISERNKIDTQSRAYAYIRRKRLISGQIYIENLKTPKEQNTQKKPQKPLGWFFFKPGCFPTLRRRQAN
jgi:hypothetical protein